MTFSHVTFIKKKAIFRLPIQIIAATENYNGTLFY